MDIPLLGGAYTGRSRDANAQECINLWLDGDQVGGRHALVTRDGLRRIGAIPTVPTTYADDYANMLAFQQPYEAPEGVTFTMTSTHATGQTGAQTITGTITGLSATSGDDLYWGDYQVGVYDYGDEYFSAIYSGSTQPYPLTSADQVAGTFSFTATLFAGVKVLRLEKKHTALAVTGVTASSSPNTATVTVAGWQGFAVVPGNRPIVKGTTYRVSGTGGVTYNGTAYTPGATFMGVAADDDFKLDHEDAVLTRLFEFYDLFWWSGSSVGARDNIYRILTGTESLGSELITTGDFSASTGWTLGTGWTISGSQAHRTAPQTTTGDLTETTPPLTASTEYKVVIVVNTYTRGTLNAVLGTVTSPDIKATGTHTFYITADDTAFILRADADFEGILDSVTVKAVSTIITLRDAQNNGAAVDGTITPFTPVAETYQDRNHFRSYSVPRDNPGGLFNIIGYRSFSYDEAMALKASLAYVDQTTSDEIIPVLEDKAYPLVDSGGTWAQVAGLGETGVWGAGYEKVQSSVVYRNRLHVGLGVSAGDAEVYSLNNAGEWSKIAGDGVNSSWSAGDEETVAALAVHDDYLYAALDVPDAELWGWNGVTWAQADTGFGAGSQEAIRSMTVWKGLLYVGLGTTAGADAQVWSYNGLGATTPTWTQVAGPAAAGGWNADANILTVTALQATRTSLFAGLSTSGNAGAVWEYDGTTWTKRGGDGTGFTCNQVVSMAWYQDVLYIGTLDGTDPAHVYSWDGSVWTQVGGDSLNYSWATGTYQGVDELTVYNGLLYATPYGTANAETECWRYDGVNWEQIGGDGLNSGWNTDYENSPSMTEWNGKLYVGMADSSGDADVWAWTPANTHDSNAGNLAFSYYLHGYNASRQTGADLVTNGVFAAGTWTEGGRWLIGAGVCAHTAGVGTSDLSQTITASLTEDAEYILTYDVTAYSAGSFTPYVGGTAGTAVTATGTNLTQKIKAGADEILKFTASADGVFSIDNVRLRLADEKVLAPDPYFRTGASMYVAQALGFYLEKYPAGTHATAATTLLRNLLDHLIDEYLVTIPNHPQQWAFRGGKGQYDIQDPAYTWHPDLRIDWVSCEHNIDAWWALTLAANASIDSYSRVLAEQNLTYSTLAANVGLKLINDEADDGFWMEDKKRCMQGITARKVVEVDVSEKEITIRGILTDLFVDGYTFDLTEDPEGGNNGTYTVASSAASATTTASDAVEDDRYYIVSAGNVTYDNVSYGDDHPTSIFGGRNGVSTYSGSGTVKPYETVITVDEALPGSDVGHAVADNYYGYVVFQDRAAALDTNSWYIPFAMAYGNTQRALDAAPFVYNNFKVVDPVHANVAGYKPYLATIPDTELSQQETLDSDGAMQPWSDLAYPTASDGVWLEGTFGVTTAWLALGDTGAGFYSLYNTDFWDAYPAREIGATGYPYTTVAEEEYEMQTWASLASTAWAVVTQGPNNFWEVNPTLFVDNMSTTREIRGMLEVNGLLYVVSGNIVVSFNSQFALVALVSTSVLLTSEGPVTMASNGHVLMINDGTTNVAYTYNVDTTTWTQITAEEDGFYGGGSVAFLDSYFLSHRPGTNAVYYSSVTSSSNWTPTWNSLQVFTAEAVPGDVVRLFVDHRELWVFKEQSTEVFFTVGDASLPFRRRQGGALDHGCLAPFSVAAVDDTIYWQAHDGTIRRALGLTPEVASVPQVSYQMGRLIDRTNAEALGYIKDGRGWYVISYPTDGVTWAFELTTSNWVKWASYVDDGQDDGQWRGRVYANFSGEDVVGDYHFGRLLAIDPETHLDDGELRKWVRHTPAIYEDEGDQFIYSLELELEGGVGTLRGEGQVPTVALQLSFDGGHTFTSERWGTYGAIGDYGAGAYWYRLGRALRTVLRFTGSDPVKTVLMGARAHTGTGTVARGVRSGK